MSWIGTNSILWQSVDEIFVATNTSIAFYFSITDPVGIEYVEFDATFLQKYVPLSLKYDFDDSKFHLGTLESGVVSLSEGDSLQTIAIATTDGNGKLVIKNKSTGAILSAVSGAVGHTGINAEKLYLGCDENESHQWLHTIKRIEVLK